MPRKRACDSCHAKKIHCDRGEPRCEWCTHRNFLCTYSRAIIQKDKTPEYDSTHKTPAHLSHFRREGKQEIGLQDQIEHRIARLEELLGARVQRTRQSFQSAENFAQRPTFKPEPTGHASLETESVSSQPSKQGIFYGSLHFAGCDLGDISSQVGIPVFSQDGLKWIQDRTGASKLFESVYWRKNGDDRHSAHSPVKPEARSPLPPKETSHCCYAIFCSSPLRRVFPIIDIHSFHETVQQAYEAGESGNPEKLGAIACIFAFLAVLSLLEPEKTSIGLTEAKQYAREGHDYLLHILNEPTLEGLQAALMLVRQTSVSNVQTILRELTRIKCIFYDFSGNIQSASVVHAMAVRCVYALGGHLNHRVQMSPGTSNHLRDLFWLCYFFDKHISLRTGQPSSVSDIECDLSLDGYIGLAAIEKPAESLYPSDLRLTAIKSKVSTVLYSPSALRKSDSELLRDIRDLDDQLEEWRLSVPAYARPRLSVLDVDAAMNILQHDFRMLVIFIHLEYLYLVSTIHRACGRCAAWSGETGRPEAVNSSLALSVHASRLTLIYLQAASRHIHRESFWLTIFYPVWATLTIFCNILHEPNSGLALSDIEMLGSVPQLIKEMPTRALAPAELGHLKVLDAFVAELVRLANCAARKTSVA